MKIKITVFVVLFVALSIGSLYYVLMYQQVLVQDAQETQLLSQVKITKIEYNSSEPTLINGTTFVNFVCNITYNNPTNSTCYLRIMGIKYLRNQTTTFYIPFIYYRDMIVLNPGNTVITEKLDNTAKATETYDAYPVFSLTTCVAQEGHGRYFHSVVQDNKTDNSVYGRTLGDQTYDLLSNYSNLAAVVWIVGLGPALTVMLLVSKGKQQVERWAACVFAFNILCASAAILLTLWPKPPPSIVDYTYSSSFVGGVGYSEGVGFFLTVTILGGIFGCGLNFYALKLLLNHSQSAKNRSYIAGGYMFIAGLILSVFIQAIGLFSQWFNIVFWTFVIIAIANAVALIRLRGVYKQKIPLPKLP
jgi:hypothetical protein